MATCKRYIPEPATPPPERVTLDISLDEAKALRDVFARIGGSPERSRRKHIDRICDALDACAIYGTNREDMPRLTTYAGIKFEDSE